MKKIIIQFLLVYLLILGFYFLFGNWNFYKYLLGLTKEKPDITIIFLREAFLPTVIIFTGIKVLDYFKYKRG